MKEKVHQNNKLHDFGFKNIKQTIKEPSKINIQQTSYQQTINLKQNLQENEHFGSIPRTYLKGSNRIDYILYSFNILTSITQCEMTAFGELVSSEHRWLYIDLPTTSIEQHINDEIPSSFQKTLKSSCPRSVRVYKRHLENQITKNKILDKMKSLLTIVATRKLSAVEEKSLNNVYSSITQIMIETENKTNKCNHNYPWSPDLHIAIKTLFIWKLVKTQITNHISQDLQIKKIHSSLLEPINIHWNTVSEVRHNIYHALLQLKIIMWNASELRKQHILTRASVMNLENRNQDSNTIINIQRIEQTIKMWRTINYLTRHTKSPSLQTIAIPEDSSISWNERKNTKDYN